MSRRHELEQRLRKLGEIGEIMRSMKNLALMETRKLARFLDVQGESVRLIEAVAVDFLQFHPQLALPSPVGQQALLVIGAERGFCGDFNEELLQTLAGDVSPILAVGGKLCARLEKYPAVAGQFDGPTVSEDVPGILNQLLPAIRRLQDARDCQGLTVLHHRSGVEGVVRKPLLPPFGQYLGPNAATDGKTVDIGNPLPPGEGAERANPLVATTNPPQVVNLSAPGTQYPPLLNLEPERFFAELVHHYLFAALHEIFYTSLMAENQRRIQHLEGAIQRLEEKNEELARKSRTLRQEEITEEIEVILLSVEGAVRR